MEWEMPSSAKSENTRKGIITLDNSDIKPSRCQNVCLKNLAPVTSHQIQGCQPMIMHHNRKIYSVIGNSENRIKNVNNTSFDQNLYGMHKINYPTLRTMLQPRASMCGDGTALSKRVFNLIPMDANGSLSGRAPAVAVIHVHSEFRIPVERIPRVVLQRPFQMANVSQNESELPSLNVTSVTNNPSCYMHSDIIGSNNLSEVQLKSELLDGSSEGRSDFSLVKSGNPCSLRADSKGTNDLSAQIKSELLYSRTEHKDGMRVLTNSTNLSQESIIPSLLKHNHGTGNFCKTSSQTIFKTEAANHMVKNENHLLSGDRLKQVTPTDCNKSMRLNDAKRKGKSHNVDESNNKKPRYLDRNKDNCKGRSFSDQNELAAIVVKGETYKRFQYLREGHRVKMSIEEFFNHLLSLEESQQYKEKCGIVTESDQNLRKCMQSAHHKNSLVNNPSSKGVESPSAAAPGCLGMNEVESHEIGLTPSPRHATASRQELLDLQQSQESKMKGRTLSDHSKKQIMWSVGVFKNWMQEKGFDPYFEHQSKEHINKVMGRFYVEVRTKDGSKYSTNSLYQFKHRLNRYLNSSPFNRNINIATDEEFRPSNMILMAVLQELQNKPDTPQIIPNSDLQKLYTTGCLSTKSPVNLSWKVWFEITYFLCSANSKLGQEFQRNCKKHDLVLHEDENGQYFTFSDEILRKHFDSSSELRMNALSHDPSRCPVRSTIMYLEKLSPRNEFLFQYPRSGTGITHSTWYSAVPIASDRLNYMMKSISKAAGLTKLYLLKSVVHTAEKNNFRLLI